MRYKKLPTLRNTYPTSGSAVSNYPKQFSGNDTSIKYTGKYPENFIIFNSIPSSELVLTTLSTDDVIDFQFIVQFVDGTEIDEWTSISFKKDLEAARLEYNPYFSKGRVTVAQIDFGKLKDYHTNFAQDELNAQVLVDSTMQSKEDIIRHINWMVNPVQDEIRTASEFGSWSVPPADEIIFGVEFISEDDLKPKIIESDRVESTIAESVKIDYSPYGVPGRYIGDIRYRKSGLFNLFKTPDYEWTGNNWQNL